MTQTYSRNARFMLLAGAALAAFAAPAVTIAQETEAADGAASLPTEIVVTARGREQRLQDVPVAVSVVSGAELERADLRSLQDVTARLPNVKINNGTNTDVLVVRGVGSGANVGFEQAVGTFVDGVYRGRSRATRAALFDLDRVEVLRGPQTTFFGHNAVAGALNIITRKPGNEFAANGSALYELEHGEYSFEAGVTVPLADTLSVRAAGRLSGMDGFVENVTLGRDGPRMRDAIGRVSVRFEPTSNFTSDLRVDMARLRSRDAFPGEIVGCPPPAVYGGVGLACGQLLGSATPESRFDYTASGRETYFNYDYTEAAWTNTLELGSTTLTSITAYFEHDNDAKIQLIPTPNVGFGGSGILPTRNLEEFEQFSQEIRLQSDTGNTIDWMVGGYYAHGKLEARNRTGFHFVPFVLIVPGLTTPLAPNTPVGGRPTMSQRDDVYSAFGSITWRATEALRLNLAARYSKVDKRANRTMTWGIIDGELGGPDGEAFTPFPQADQLAIGANRGVSMTDYPITNRTDDKFMPSVGIEYDLTGDIMAYATYSYGFKAGGYDASAQGGIYGPETVNAYELGLKGSMAGGLGTFSLALFRSDYSDLQETTIVFNGVGEAQRITAVTANAAGARVQGIELSGSIQAADWLRINADLGYLDATYTDFPNASCTILGTAQNPNCVQDMSGKRRGYAPEWTGTLSANVNVPLGDTLQLRIDPSLFFSSKYFMSATADPLLSQDGFAKVDLRVGVGPDNRSWELAVIARNLTDKATSSFIAPLPTSNGATIVYPDRPRSIALAASFKF
ncbi:TonB-dependent receptor [Altererythrobacter sp. H2]|uniref:TonB-dependent receptor n=1 Tax=Altererythrobacter sp. H2 TaxID=3108391 RepID=UPI002B4BB0F1|nr:TonB-dependent receptor [Altererythrobacter sp. H2]WRK95167.1 TonB-dependent receptor [Altererythrobacter sp. H2]